MTASRLYAQVTGVVLFLLDILGLFTGPQAFGLNSALIEDIVHIAAGAVALYAGFGARQSSVPATQYARIFGAVYLLLGILGFIAPRLFGLFPTNNPLRIQDHIVHLALGAVGLFVGLAAASRGSSRV